MRRRESPRRRRPVAAPGRERRSLIGDAGQLFGLVLLLQCADQLLQSSVHDLGQLVEREIDAMVGDPALREIVSADAFGTIARADLELARASLGLLALVALSGGQAGFEQRQGARAILVLRAFVLALDHDAGRQVSDADR